MMDVIEYIRSFFMPTRPKRKRSTSDVIEELVGPSKYRRLSSFPTDKLLFPNSMLPSKNKKTNKSLTIVLDEEAENIAGACNTVKTKAPLSSTPNLFKPAMSISQASLNCSSYFTPNSDTNELSALSGRNKSGQRSSKTMDCVFRLEEKLKYQQLLNRSAAKTTGALADSFASYYTPIGRTQFGRGRQMVEMVKSSSEKIVDLTGGSSESKTGKKHLNLNGRAARTTTSETILKVLDDIDDVVVVKDSDSDVEFLPTPPSPQPDFKVEPVNSLKLLASTCEPMQQDWIGKKVRKHREELQRFTSELETRESKLAEVRRINNELLREQLEQQVAKCLHIKEVVLPVEVRVALPELSGKQEQLVDAALDKRAPPGTVLSSKFGLNITRRDMFTLYGLNWLNDEVINFYMELINERARRGGALPSAYAFNTFFYPKILKTGQQSVRRWTRKIDLFAHRLLCVPIHLGVHWCMAIVDLRAKTISYYDSMGKPNAPCTEAIFKYLQDEHADKKGAPFDTAGWQLRSGVHDDVPQQMNGSDCGMFSCTYAEFATRSAPFTFSQADMPYLRRKMVVEIINGQLLIQ